MSAKPSKLKLIAVALILALTAATYVTHQWHKRYRLQQAEQKWQDTQTYAKEMGVELDLNALIDSRKGEGISLIDDHEWIRELFEMKGEYRNKLVELPDLDVEAIAYSQDHEDNMQSIREILKLPDDSSLTDKQLIEKLLEAMAPCNEELDRFKAAVMESGDFGADYLKSTGGFVNISLSTKLNGRLMARSYCTLMLGNEDMSDMIAVCKFHDLYTKHSATTFIDVTAQVAIKHHMQAVANAYAYSPQADSHTIKRFIEMIPRSPCHLNFREKYRTEVPAVLVIMDQMKTNPDTTENPFLPNATLIPDHIFLDIRSDYVRFFIDQLIRPGDQNPIKPSELKLTSVVDDPTISHLKLPSRTILPIVCIGLKYYYHCVLKADMTASISHLALASRAYQLEHGNYPEKLEVLVPEYLDKLPTIPHSGQAYTYTAPTKGETLPNFTGSLMFGDKQIEVNWLYPVED